MTASRVCFIISEIVVVIFVSGQCPAAFILDTGTPIGPNLPAPSLEQLPSSFQFIAGRFQTPTKSRITGVEGHFNAFGSGTMTFTITGPDDAGLPDLSTTLHSVSGTLEVPTRDWAGVVGLNWIVESGTYWLVLMPQNLSTSMPTGSPFPTVTAAISETSGKWLFMSVSDLGFRISGEAVPEPVTWVLFAIAAAAFIFHSRCSRAAGSDAPFRYQFLLMP
jgi:hypothetical protein